MAHFLKTICVWLYERIPLLFHLLGLTNRASSVAADVRRFREGLGEGRRQFLLHVILSSILSAIVRLRQSRRTSWVYIFVVGVSAQTIAYAIIWWGGTFGAWQKIQTELPWKTYETSVATAADILKKPDVDSNSRRHLTHFVTETNFAAKVIFTIAYTVFAATIFALILRISLRVSELLISDCGHSFRFFPLFFSALGAFALRLAFESAAFGLLFIAQYPLIWMIIYPLISMAMTQPVAGIVLFGLFALASLGGWFGLPDLTIFFVHILTLPLRVTTYALGMCLVLFVLNEVAVRFVSFAASRIESLLLRKVDN